MSELFHAIREISRNNVSILLIEQNAIQALQRSHRGYVLEHGHLAYEGDADGLLNNDTVKSAYLGI